MDEHRNRHLTVNIQRRWWALIVLQLGFGMIVVDGTIVDIALGPIESDLRFSHASLVWIVNAYLVTFAGCLVLAGRLADVFGRRRVFLIGIAIFTLASLFCGLARSQALLISGRALQGIGGAIITAGSLSITLDLFADGPERVKAMAVSSVIAAGGGSLGLLLGGTLTSTLDWHWIFLVNLPVGAAVYSFGTVLIPQDEDDPSERSINVASAIVVTASLMLAAYALSTAGTVGWTSARLITLLVVSAALFLLFVYIDARASVPLLPLGLFRNSNFRAGSIALALLATTVSGWYFFLTLYLQLVLAWDAMKVGIAFLPSNVVMAAFSLGLSAQVVGRFGIRAPLIAGLILTTAGLMLFSRVPLNAQLAKDIVPGMVLLGLGVNIAWCSLFMAAMSNIPRKDSGLASGLITTTSTMGTVVGLTLLAGVAEATTNSMLAAGHLSAVALNAGYRAALLSCAGISAAASFCVMLLKELRPA